jgi:excisionase family DNA binding protein
MNLSYSIKQVCALTGIGQTKVYEAINEGLLPAKKYGRRTIILKDDLGSFLKALDDRPIQESRTIPP